MANASQCHVMLTSHQSNTSRKVAHGTVVQKQPLPATAACMLLRIPIKPKTSTHASCDGDCKQRYSSPCMYECPQSPQSQRQVLHTITTAAAALQHAQGQHAVVVPCNSSHCCTACLLLQCWWQGPHYCSSASMASSCCC